jgi:hypothetical protein
LPLAPYIKRISCGIGGYKRPAAPATQRALRGTGAFLRGFQTSGTQFFILRKAIIRISEFIQIGFPDVNLSRTQIQNQRRGLPGYCIFRQGREANFHSLLRGLRGLRVITLHFRRKGDTLQFQALHTGCGRRSQLESARQRPPHAAGGNPPDTCRASIR